MYLLLLLYFIYVSNSLFIASGLDISSVLRAYQVISSEMDLTKLIGNMVKIVIQNTGAQKGIFVVPDQSGTYQIPLSLK